MSLSIRLNEILDSTELEIAGKSEPVYSQLLFISAVREYYCYLTKPTLISVLACFSKDISERLDQGTYTKPCRLFREYIEGQGIALSNLYSMQGDRPIIKRSRDGLVVSS
jgi:hypothetical protein